MILKATQQDSDANNANDYFNSMRKKNYEASFGGVEDFIRETRDKLRHPRQKKRVRSWQLALAVLFPLLVVLACTKTEYTEPVGQTLSFSVPNGDEAARQAVEPIIGGLQTVFSPDKQKPNYLSYTSFIPAKSNPSADAIISQLKKVKGIADLSIVPVNAQVKESLLSQLGNKIFSTHVNATGLSDNELQSTVNRQLREKGFNDILVAVTRDKNGLRTLELHPAKDASNYIVDMSIDDTGTRMVLKEERRTTADKPKTSEGPNVDFTNMTDAQVRDYIRQQYGKELQDENIKITRTAEELSINIKQSDKQEEIMRFKLK